jgi:hypothetical protein
MKLLIAQQLENKQLQTQLQELQAVQQKVVEHQAAVMKALNSVTCQQASTNFHANPQIQEQLLLQQQQQQQQQQHHHQQQPQQQLLQLPQPHQHPAELLPLILPNPDSDEAFKQDPFGSPKSPTLRFDIQILFRRLPGYRTWDLFFFRLFSRHPSTDPRRHSSI